MKTINLGQLSSFVVIMLAASFFVSATEKEAAKPVQAVPAINDVAFNTLDLDKNGMLSQQEIIASNNEVLVKSFPKIDQNADLSLSKQELADFVIQIKGA